METADTEKVFRWLDCDVEVVDGDVTTLEVDAIVCSANTSLQLGGRGSVAGAIVAATNGKVVEELALVPRPIPLGAAVVTSGAGLPVRHVIHVATHGTSGEEMAAMAAWGLDDPLPLRLKVIGECVASAMKRAAELGCRSLAIPALATGALRLPLDLAAQAMVNTLHETLAVQTTPLDRVLLVTHKAPELRKALSEAVAAVAQDARPPEPTDEERDQAMRASITTLLAELPERGPEALTEAVRQLHGHDEPPARGAESPFLQSVEAIALVLAQEVLRLGRSLEDRDAELAAANALRSQGKPDLDAIPAAQIRVDDLPLPVAFAVDSVEATTDPQLRCENLRKGLSLLLRYLTMIALAEYREAGAPDEALNGLLREAFASSLTDGTWRHVASEVARSFLDRTPRCVLELPSAWHRDHKQFSPLNGSLQRLVTLRNTIHDLGRVDDSTASRWLDDALPAWRSILEKARPLLAYRLVYIESLLTFVPGSLGTVRYAVRWLSGDRNVPPSELVEWHAELQKGELYLTDGSGARFLPLSPFLSYAYCDVTHAREVFSFEYAKDEEVILTTVRFPKTEGRPLTKELGFWK